MKNDLFTVIIICYRHFAFLYEAIDSVLSQDYDNIELIVADDGSDNFPGSEVERYINDHKGSNIAKVVIWQEEHNCGTVRHINNSLEFATGTYITLLAGDDTLYDNKVLSKYAKGFAEPNNDYLIEMAQVAMCDYTLDNVEYYYLSSDVQKAIEESRYSTEHLKKCLIKYGACLPSTSTCFKKNFFEAAGKFDESYSLIEDYPMHVRLAFKGIPIHYENMVAVKHRTGGISHGQVNSVSSSALKYWLDTKKCYEDIRLKNLDVLDKSDRYLTRVMLQKSILWIDLLLAKSNGKVLSLIIDMIKYFGCTVDLGFSAVRDFVFKYALKSVIIACIINVMLPFTFRFCNSIFSYDLSGIIYGIIEKLGYISIAAAAAFWILLIIFRILDRLSTASAY